MSTTFTITLPAAVFEQTQQLAQQLNLSQAELVVLALEHFIQAQQPATTSATNPKIIQQGDVYWVQLADQTTSIPHPHVVLQADVLNQSRIDTVVVCGLTTNITRANGTGNVLLEIGEANLPKQSVVEVSKVSTIMKTQLGDYIGTLAEQRVKQILAGMQFLQRSFF